MRWLVLAAWLFVTVGSSVRADRLPVVLAPSYTNIVEFALRPTQLWLNIPGESPQTIEVTHLGSNQYKIFFRRAESVNTGSTRPEFAACRWLENGRWSRISTIVIDPILPERLQVPCSFTGIVHANERVRFAFSVTNRHEFSGFRFEVVANRIGSELDPELRLLNEKGEEILRSDDDLRAARDARIKFPLPKNAQWRTQKFIVEVFDATNSGGPDFFFHLRGGIDFEGRDYWMGMNWVELSQPIFDFYEKEPNDSPASADLLSVGRTIRSEFQSKHRTDDRDWFKFEAAANQRIILTAETRRLGSPCDAGLSLFDDDGKLISEAIGNGAEGASITNNFSKAGLYRLEVREISRLAGPGFDYWLTLREFKSGVILETGSERVDFSKEGEATIKIACKRYDYDGQVKLEVDGLPDGVSVVDGIIPEKKNEVELKLKREMKVAAFQIRIKGVIEQKDAKDTSVKAEFPVSTMPALRELYPLQIFPCTAMDGWIAVNPPKD